MEVLNNHQAVCSILQRITPDAEYSGFINTLPNLIVEEELLRTLISILGVRTVGCHKNDIDPWLVDRRLGRSIGRDIVSFIHEG